MLPLLAILLLDPQQLTAQIDPVAGVWVRAGGKLTHVCGKDLAVLGAELDVRVGFHQDAACKDGACVLAFDDDPSPVLVFMRSRPGVVCALDRDGDREHPIAPPPDRCPAGVKVPARDDAPLVDKRTEPKGDLNPTVATDELLQKIASGAWKLERFADPVHGLVFIDHTPDASDNPNSPWFEKHLCGKDLLAALPDLQKRIGAKVAQTKDMPVGCDGESCSMSAEMEYDSAWNITFRRDAKRGLLLESVQIYDSAGVSERSAEHEELTYETELAKSWMNPCP